MPRKRILPPVFFLVYLIAAFLLNRLLPIAAMVPLAWRPVGWVICGLGAALNVWGSSLFRRRGTAIKPFEPSTALVCDGPFRLSRNPMYVGGVAMLLGVATVLGSLTAFLVPLAMFLTLQLWFIPHEERMLEETFGSAYRDYRRRVRRWL